MEMNRDIRAMVITKGLKAYEVARELGISDMTYYRRLRGKLSPERRNEFIKAINAVADHKEADGVHD